MLSNVNHSTKISKYFFNLLQLAEKLIFSITVKLPCNGHRRDCNNNDRYLEVAVNRSAILPDDHYRVHIKKPNTYTIICKTIRAQHQ